MYNNFNNIKSLNEEAQKWVRQNFEEITCKREAFHNYERCKHLLFLIAREDEGLSLSSSIHLLETLREYFLGVGIKVLTDDFLELLDAHEDQTPFSSILKGITVERKKMMPWELSKIQFLEDLKATILEQQKSIIVAKAESVVEQEVS